MNARDHLLACCVEAPAAYAPKARHALRMLLLPLGIDPQWSTRADLTAGGLYYGTEAAPPGTLRLPMDPAAPACFASDAKYPAERVQWRDWQGEPWPMLFGDDLVASAFFWLSGWQERVERMRDRHGRFPHSASWQAVLGVTTRPVVDAYRAMLAERLDALGIPVRRRTWGGAEWALCPTHDIDYLRKWRPGMVYRETVQYFLRNQRGLSPGERVRRLARFAKDWVRTGDAYRQAFERMHEEVAVRGGTATYFLKMGAHGAHDTPYPPDHPYLRSRVAALHADGFEVGLHPSYFAHTHAGYLQQERDRLAGLIAQPPVSVRQHYLRFEAPATPRRQAAAGFRIDSTLGFADHEGFRHGTCLPFQLFDLEANAPLDLWEMPLAVMESALFNRRNLDADGARAATEEMLQACRRFRGAAVVLWHNVLWDELDYPGWGGHFLGTLDEAIRHGACIASLQQALDAWLVS